MNLDNGLTEHFQVKLSKVYQLKFVELQGFHVFGFNFFQTHFNDFQNKKICIALRKPTFKKVLSTYTTLPLHIHLLKMCS